MANARSLPRGRPVQSSPNDERMLQRAHPDVKSVAPPPSFTLVDPQVIVEQVAERVLDGIAEILRDPSQGERLLDDAGMRQVLQCSQPVLRGLLEDNLPHVKVGEMRRYRVSTVLAWLESRESGKDGSK